MIVQVIDSGIDEDHEDHQVNRWLNEGEICNNGLDDDNNGYVDDCHGYNNADDTHALLGDGDHGIHCAGESIPTPAPASICVPHAPYAHHVQACKSMRSRQSHNMPLQHEHHQARSGRRMTTVLVLLAWQAASMDSRA